VVAPCDAAPIVDCAVKNALDPTKKYNSFVGRVLQAKKNVTYGGEAILRDLNYRLKKSFSFFLYIHPQPPVEQ